MIENLSIAISHFEFLQKYGRIYDTLSEPGKVYLVSVKRCVISELTYFIAENSPNMERVLKMYMDSKVLRLIFTEVFGSRVNLTKPVIDLSWRFGNLKILRKCVELEINIEPQKNLTSSIRCGKPRVFDFCIQNGGIVNFRPYSLCRTTKMMKHLHLRGYYLHTRINMFPHNKYHLNDLYLKLGGHITEMGTLNQHFNKIGNIERSIPLRMAFIRSRRKGKKTIYKDLGKAIELPGTIVGLISTYL